MRLPARVIAYLSAEVKSFLSASSHQCIIGPVAKAGGGVDKYRWPAEHWRSGRAEQEGDNSAGGCKLCRLWALSCYPPRAEPGEIKDDRAGGSLVEISAPVAVATPEMAAHVTAI